MYGDDRDVYGMLLYRVHRRVDGISLYEMFRGIVVRRTQIVNILE